MYIEYRIKVMNWYDVLNSEIYLIIKKINY